MADVLVQPGKSNKFNDYRFPSKLPEFLSASRPVILPNANLARYMTHGLHGFILVDCNAVAIADSIREIMSNPELYNRLAAGALDFFRARLSWAESAKKLNEFYSSATPRLMAAHCAA
jgi:glycosyltransferase involved in cell wall biosynthesis